MNRRISVTRLAVFVVESRCRKWLWW